MSVASSEALQKAVFSYLVLDEELQTAVDGAIFDVLPSGQKPEIYVSLGPEVVRSRGDVTACGSQHDFTISVIASGGGFSSLKRVAGLVGDALSTDNLSLERGTLIYLRFLKAAAKRVRGAGGRQIDLTFRARIDDN